MAILSKQVIDENVLTKAVERINYIYDNFDTIVVSFSGGKDSTVVLNLVTQVAKERNKLPVKVVFFDEEAIHPDTIDYVHRVRERDDIDLDWYCLEIKHRNACSRTQPHWYCWDKEEEDKWIRPMPECAISEHPKFVKGMTMPEFAPYLFGNETGRMAMVQGIRANESLRRYRSVAHREKENYIALKSKSGVKVWSGRVKGGRAMNYYNAYPIYDFNAKDVWVCTAQHEWDYNKTYDVFQQTGMNLEKQRVCPPYGEEPLRGLWIYSVCYPDMWAKMIDRVHGVATAWRYGNTELYGAFMKEPPAGLTWKEYLPMCIDLNGKKERYLVTKTVNGLIEIHNKKSKEVIPEAVPDPHSGVSYKVLCKVALKGDLKGRTSQSLQWDTSIHDKEKHETAFRSN